MGCNPCDQAFGIPSRMDPDLKRYWTRGEGAAKIRWGTDGSFGRCERLLAKYFPQNTGGLCANLHHAATGEWPTEHGDKGLPS